MHLALRFLNKAKPQSLQMEDREKRAPTGWGRTAPLWAWRSVWMEPARGQLEGDLGLGGKVRVLTPAVVALGLQPPGKGASPAPLLQTPVQS